MKTTPQSPSAQPRAPSLRPAVPAGPGSGGTPSRIPIAQRWERLDHGLPSSPLITDYYVRSLQQLLDTPLEVLYAQEDDTSKRWNKCLTFSLTYEEFKHLATPSLDAQGRPFFTYRDALLMAHNLVEELKRNDLRSFERTDLREILDGLLVGLAYLLLQSPEPLTKAAFDKGKVISLTERLAHLGPGERSNVPARQILDGKPNTQWNSIMQNAVRSQEYPILAAPLSHYLCAASEIYGSDLPLRAGHHSFKGFLVPGNGNIMFNLVTMLKIGLREIPTSKRCSNDPDCGLLYSLLVMPIFPSEDMDDKYEEEEQ